LYQLQPAVAVSNEDMARLVETYWAVSVLDVVSDPDSRVPEVPLPIHRKPLWDHDSANSANAHVIQVYHADGSRSRKLQESADAYDVPRVLWSSGDNGAKLLRAHIQLMLDNGLALPSTMPDLPTKAKDRSLWTWLFSPTTNLEGAMRDYVNRMRIDSKLCATDDDKLGCLTRDRVFRTDWFVQPRDVLEIKTSRGGGTNAGIATSDDDRMRLVPVSSNFFTEPISPPRLPGVTEAMLYDAMKWLEAPVVGGVTNDIFEDIILSLEEVRAGDTSDEGLVSYRNRKAREAILGVWMAVLVAAGRHSLLEMLLTAKAFGYFKRVQLPSFRLTLHGKEGVHRFMEEPASFGYRQSIYQLIQALNAVGISGPPDMLARVKVNANSLGDQNTVQERDFEREISRLQSKGLRLKPKRV